MGLEKHAASGRPSVPLSLSFIFSASTSLQPRVNKKDSLFFFFFFFFLICPPLSRLVSLNDKRIHPPERYGAHVEGPVVPSFSPFFSPSIAALSVSTRGWKSPPNELYNYYYT
jgi:hypothetical protein